MSSKRANPLSVPSADPYLPGITCDTACPPPAGSDRTGWWVRTSARQSLDAFGRLEGFKHDLMYRGRVKRTGKGADAGRAFRAQADFLNRRNRPPLTS